MRSTQWGMQSGTSLAQGWGRPCHAESTALWITTSYPVFYESSIYHNITRKAAVVWCTIPIAHHLTSALGVQMLAREVGNSPPLEADQPGPCPPAWPFLSAAPRWDLVISKQCKELTDNLHFTANNWMGKCWGQISCLCRHTVKYPNTTTTANLHILYYTTKFQGTLHWKENHIGFNMLYSIQNPLTIYYNAHL